MGKAWTLNLAICFCKMFFFLLLAPESAPEKNVAIVSPENKTIKGKLFFNKGLIISGAGAPMPPTLGPVAHLMSKDAAAAPKHHGSEGRIGPAAGSPDCQTSLSERRESSCKPCLYLPFGTATLGPRTLRQHQNTMAVRDGSGPRPAAQTAKRRFLNA